MGARGSSRSGCAGSWLLAVGVAVGAGGCRPEPTDASRCAREGIAWFEAVAHAERETAEACVRGGQGALGALSLADCRASDPLRLVERARHRSLDAEQRHCGTGAPLPVGFAGAEAANRFAREAADDAVRGLFGLDPDAALRGREASGSRCQRAVLDRAYRCSARFVRAYVDCASSLLERGVDDPFELVACKGVDPGGEVSAACGSALEDEVTTSCAGEEIATLFPGCAGDLAACARAHARRSASLASNGAAALCSGVREGTLDEETLLRCFEPPAEEPIVFRDVPLPEGVNPGGASFTESGDSIVLAFTAPGVAGTQLAIVGKDGSGFRCLTCGSAVSGNQRPAQIFRDGRRVLVAGPNGPAPKWSVLECEPSLLDCASSTLVPIELPPNPDPTTPILQYRVPHVTYDDGWFLWTEVRLRGPGGNLVAMGRLVRDADRYVVADARVVTPAAGSLDPGDDPAVWQGITQPFEAKEAQLRGGRDWVIAGTPAAGQYDNLLLDLETGTLRRLTHHPDHDEGLNYSRDEEWVVMSSARTDERVEFLGLVPRPPYIDWLAFSVHFVGIAGAPSDGLSPGSNPIERDCYLDPWILDRWMERGDYLGQRLLRPADGWQSAAGGFDWSPDGTEILTRELGWRRLTPPGGSEPSRIRIAKLTNRPALDPAAFVPQAPTPEPTWAIRYEDWIVPNGFGETRIRGAHSGRAIVRNALPAVVQGTLEVEFQDYSDDGLVFLDGIERIEIPVLINLGVRYSVDLVVSGFHQGSMRGEILYDFERDVNEGEVVAELDGRVLRGPKTCFEAGLIPSP